MTLAALSDWAGSVLAAELTREEAWSLVLVFLATTLGAVLSRWHLRLVLPTVVVEIVLGIVIGPEGLGIAEVNDLIAFLSQFGLALLFFFAGVEVIEHHVPKDVLRRGTFGWGISLYVSEWWRNSIRCPRCGELFFRWQGSVTGGRCRSCKQPKWATYNVPRED